MTLLTSTVLTKAFFGYITDDMTIFILYIEYHTILIVLHFVVILNVYTGLKRAQTANF